MSAETKRREHARKQYYSASTHGRIVDAFERALIYKDALKKIGSMFITAEVKEVIIKALEDGNAIT